MLRLMDAVRKKHLDWINAIQDGKGLNRKRLADLAGVDPSTLTKFVNDRSGTARLNTYTIERIVAATGVPAFETNLPARPRGMAESEASPFDHEASPEAAAIDAWKMGRNHIDAWTLQSRALENAGYVPGDILMVDLNETPRSGDVVCAQVYGANGRAETLMRVYEHPFLVASTHDASLLRPLLVNGDSVAIRGVVMGSIRPRRAA